MAISGRSGAGPLGIGHGSAGTVVNCECVIEDNVASYMAGAVYRTSAQSAVEIKRLQGFPGNDIIVLRQFRLSKHARSSISLESSRVCAAMSPTTSSGSLGPTCGGNRRLQRSAVTADINADDHSGRCHSDLLRPHGRVMGIHATHGCWADIDRNRRTLDITGPSHDARRLGTGLSGDLTFYPTSTEDSSRHSKSAGAAVARVALQAESRCLLQAARYNVPPSSIRTGGGAAERAGLENRYSLRAIVGSNPTLSVAGPRAAREPKRAESRVAWTLGS